MLNISHDYVLKFCRVRKLIWVGAVWLPLLGCSTLELPEYSGNQISSYTNQESKDDLTISVHPIIEKVESKEYFGIDLLESNIIAIFVVVENKSISSSFVVSRNDFTLGTQKSTYDGLASDDKIASETTGDAVALTGALLISPLLLFIGAKMKSDATVIKSNLARKEFQKKTVSPGGRVEGFLYFKLPETAAVNAEPWILLADVLRLQEDVTTHFEFEIEVSR